MSEIFKRRYFTSHYTISPGRSGRDGGVGGMRKRTPEVLGSDEMKKFLDPDDPHNEKFGLV